jgi:hypothetical protein
MTASLRFTAKRNPDGALILSYVGERSVKVCPPGKRTRTQVGFSNDQSFKGHKRAPWKG